MKTSLALVLVLGTLGFAACSSDEGGASGGGNDSSGSSSSESFECCLNGDGYTCPNRTAFDLCKGSDVGECMAECDPMDPSCQQECTEGAQPDPSDCDASDAVDCSSDDGSDDCGGTAIPCDLDLDCCEGLTCEPRQDGQEGGSCQ